ncbi:hypothetical protein EYC80_010034 [Monilinia laxa]|uniref:Uncharacterized protein n=1 Tax=Monilinia laxa TaxID=61186 RepID=A0A5N6JRE8_MONLA|nr:hypothetical protein EYC80_010034 [Monilinia laxa]
MMVFLVFCIIGLGKGMEFTGYAMFWRRAKSSVEFGSDMGKEQSEYDIRVPLPRKGYIINTYQIIQINPNTHMESLFELCRNLLIYVVSRQTRCHLSHIVPSMSGLRSHDMISTTRELLVAFRYQFRYQCLTR